MKAREILGYLVLFCMLAWLCGCEPTPTGEVSGNSLTEGFPDTPSYDSGGTRCGGLDEPCCETGIYKDAWGMIRQDSYCDDGLSCMADVCVTQYESVAYDRNEYYN